jgi:hypothetical protein
LLAYPGGLIVALGAYTWFATYFPKYLENIYPAFESSPEEFGGKIKKWADRLANRVWVIMVASVIVAIGNLINLNQLWQQKIWLGDVWATSPASLFFKIYYAFIDILAGGFILGSGAVGILGVILLLHDLLTLRLKLSHVRNLRAIASLSFGLTVWALLAFALVGPIRAVSVPNILCVAKPILKVNSTIILSNIGTSILASFATVCSLFLPVYFAHRAIIRDKRVRIENLLDTQYKLFIKAEQLTALYSTALAQEVQHPDSEDIKKKALKFNTELKQTYKNIASVYKMIAILDAVPEWPITANGIKQVIVTAFVPLLTNMVVGFLPGQTGGQNLTDLVKGMLPDIIKNLFK